MPQEELARRAGFHRSYISDIERGARNVSIKSIEKLADALGVSMFTLFTDLDGKSGPPIHSDEMVDILLVEDDDNDALLVVHALKNARLTNRIFVVRDGAAGLGFPVLYRGIRLPSHERPPPGDFAGFESA